MTIGRAYATGGGGTPAFVLVAGSPFLNVAALEAWAQANPASLFNDETQISTAFVAASLYQYRGATGTYVVDQWSDETPDGLTPEMMTVLMALINLTPGSLPVQSAAGLVDSPLSEGVDDSLVTPGELRVGLGTLLLGFAHSLRAAGENVSIENQITGINYHPGWQTYAAGNTLTSRVRTNLPELPAVSDKSGILTNPMWSQPASMGNQTIRQVVVDFTSPVTNFTIRIGILGVDFWEQNFGAFNAGEQTLIFNPPLDLRDGQIADLTASSADGDVTVRGNVSSGVPYQRPTIAVWSDVPVALSTSIRTDEDIRGVLGATLVAGMNISIDVNAEDNTVTVSSTNGGGGGTPTPAGADRIYYGLSQSDDTTTIDVTNLMREDEPTNPDMLNTGTTSSGDHFVIFVPMPHDITGIFDTVLQQDVTTIFTSLDNAQVVDTISFKSYIIGPLNTDVNEQYVINF